MSPTGFGERAAAPPVAVPYSFGQSANLTAEKTELYLEAAQQMANDMASDLAEWIPGFGIEARPLVEASAGADLHEEMPTFDVTVAFLDGRPCGSVLVDLPLGLLLVTGLLGGASLPPGDPRPLTSIERRVLDLVTQTFVGSVASTLLLEGEATASHGKEGVFSASDSDAPEARIGFNFDVQGPAGGGQLTLGFELWALQQFSDVIDARLSGRRATSATVANADTAAALQPVPLPFVVNLAHVNLTAGELVTLREGDVIRTRVAVDCNATASVGAVELYAVRLGQRGRQLTAEVVAPLDLPSTGIPATNGSATGPAAFPWTGAQ